MLIAENVHSDIDEPCPAAPAIPPVEPVGLYQASGRLVDSITSSVVKADPEATLANAAFFALIASGKLALAGVDAAQADAYANALADLAVSGAEQYAQFRALANPTTHILDIAALEQRVTSRVFTAARARGITLLVLFTDIVAAASRVVARAYDVAWALHGPAAYRQAHRANLGWIAVDAERDFPSRPVNTGATGWPMRDMNFAVPSGGRAAPIAVRIRYAISGARDSVSTRTMGHLPEDERPPRLGDRPVVLFVHGHSSRLEEGGGIADALEMERAGGVHVIAFDFPSCGYSGYTDPEQIAPIAATRFVPDHPEEGAFGMLEFLERCTVAFVEALHQRYLADQQPGILHRVAAVIGGSLGGNIGLRLSEKLVTRPEWLPLVVSWSPASAPPSLGRADYLSPSPGEHTDPVAKEALERTRQRSTASEDAGSRGDFIRLQMSGDRLINDGTPAFQTVTRILGALAGAPIDAVTGGLLPFGFLLGSAAVEVAANIVPITQSTQWLRSECQTDPDANNKRALIMALNLHETYCSIRRRMHWSVAFEQLLFSHGDGVRATRGRPCFQQSRIPTLLVAGANDHTSGWEIYNAVRGLAPGMVNNAGTTILLQDTGHSIHDERPKWLAREIVRFFDEQRHPLPAGLKRMLVLEKKIGSVTRRIYVPPAKQYVWDAQGWSAASAFDEIYVAATAEPNTEAAALYVRREGARIADAFVGSPAQRAGAAEQGFEPDATHELGFVFSSHALGTVPLLPALGTSPFPMTGYIFPRWIQLRSVAGHALVESSDRSSLRDSGGTVAGQRFELYFHSRSHVSLRSRSGFFIQAANGGGAGVNVQGHNPRQWETFELIENVGGVALRCFDGVHFLCAENAGKEALVANRTRPGPWERFEILPGNLPGQGGLVVVAPPRRGGDRRA
jgi:pimeloyl-ACP methyl ester carboxylesterase